MALAPTDQMKEINPILKTEKLGFRVNAKHSILQNIDITLSSGESMTIIGPNGAGKSTLLKCIAGLQCSTRQKNSQKKSMTGKVLISGTSIREMPYRKRGQLLAYVPQRPIFPVYMKLLDYVLLGRTSHIPTLGKEDSSDFEVALDAIDKTGIGWAIDRPLQTLSGGELQLAVIARALTTQAPLLLLDEPTASLDLGHRISQCELINDLAKKNNIAILTTMHDLELAGHFGERLLLLVDGEVCAEGSARQVLTPENIKAQYGVSVETILENDRVRILPQYKRLS